MDEGTYLVAYIDRDNYEESYWVFTGPDAKARAVAYANWFAKACAQENNLVLEDYWNGTCDPTIGSYGNEDGQLDVDVVDENPDIPGYTPPDQLDQVQELLG